MIQLGRAIYDVLRAKQLPYRGYYATHDAVERAISANRRIGYDHVEAAEMYLHDLRRVKTSDYPMLFWLRAFLSDNSRIFDWGGNLGQSFYTYATFLHFPIGLRWVVCDVPAVVDAGRRIAKELDVHGLSFTSDLSSSEGCDVLIASGSLQYISVSLASVLRASRTKPRVVFVNRTPVHPIRDFYTIHDIGPIVASYHIFREADLIGSIEAEGYVLKDRWVCHGPPSVRIPFHPDGTVEHYSGFYFHRIADATA